MKDLRNDILQFLRRDLEQDAMKWLQKLNNPLATEIDFLELEIALYKKGIESAKELHNKHHHSHLEVSVMQNEIVNFNNKIKVAEEWKAELSKGDQSNKTATIISPNNELIIDKANDYGKKNVTSHAIKLIYIAKAGGQKVTNNNIGKLAEEAGCAAGSLQNKITFYREDSNRLNLAQEKKTDSTLLKNFKLALKLLDGNLQALEIAKKDLDGLEKKFHLFYK